MTISYAEKFTFLLGRWRGSVWRAVWKALAAWLVLYYVIRITIEHFGEEHRETAKKVVQTCSSFCDKIPLSFLLGFYVGQIVSRWWYQVMRVPWPDEIMTMVNSYFPAKQSTHIRQTIARWLILCQAMAFRRLSSRIRRRFPKLDSLLEAGLLNEQELQIIRANTCLNNRWHLPLQWILIKTVVPSDIAPPAKNGLILAINQYREALRQLYIYDWINLPLVYTQTCTVVVYGYFLLCAVGHQYIAQPIDLYIPWLTIIQLLLYVGWLHVAYDLMKPFEEDDDDLELNWILDRNASVVANMADQACVECPDVVEDAEKQTTMMNCLRRLPYSQSSLHHQRNRAPKLHATIRMSRSDAQMVCPKQATVLIPGVDEDAILVQSNDKDQPSDTRKTSRKRKKDLNLF